MSEKEKGDLAVKNFKKAFSGLTLEEQMTKKWNAMALVSTQKKNLLAKQKARF